MTDEIQVAPVVTWEAGPVMRQSAVVMRMHYVTGPDQPHDKATQSPMFFMSLSQAKSIVKQLTEAVQTIEREARKGKRH